MKLPGWLKFYAPVAMLALVPTMTSFLGNRYQVSAQDLILPILVELAVAAIVAAVFYRLWRRDQPAGYLAAGLATLILASNFDSRIEGFQPLWNAVTPMASLGPLTGPVFVLVCITAIFALTGWVGRLFGALVRRRGWKAKDVAGGIVVAIMVTFGLEFFSLAGNLAAEWPQFFYKPPKLATLPDSAKTGAKPDIFYIVLDRYASNDVLREQFGYDNSEFTKFLESKGYYVNPSAHNNYPYTTMSVASTMTGDYLNDIVGKYGKSSAQTTIPFNEAVRNSPVVAALKEAGYNYHLVGNWYETSNLSPLADEEYQETGKLTVLGQTLTLNNFSKLTVMQSPFARIFRMNLGLGGFDFVSYEDVGSVEMTQGQLATLKDLAGDEAGGRFVFAHLLIPHEPYDFNADGSLSKNSASDNYGTPVKQKYLAQVEYINAQMREILTKIDEASGGKSIVVLQADEGPYPFAFDGTFNSTIVDGELQAGDMRKWSDANLRLKMGNQAAYRIPAVNFEQDSGAADSVNIFRLVLNSYFGTTLPYLPDCYYAYPDGRNKPIHFASVTERLTGQPEDPRCGSDGTVKR